MEKEDSFAGMSDRESVTHQVENWADGLPLHNTVRDECCPDFSCCNGGKMMAEESRQRLLDAHNKGDSELVETICLMGLSSLCADSDVSVHIAGDSIDTH